jgi:hypothetical protein
MINANTNRQTTAAAQALKSYLLSLQTNTEFLAILSSVSTDTAALASITAFDASVSSQLAADETPNANYLDGLPSQVRPFFSSALSEEYAILTSNGFTSRLPTSTSQAAAPRETGGLKIAGVVAAGFMGAVMAL